jgi:serine/threonine-protein kinase
MTPDTRPIPSDRLEGMVLAWQEGYERGRDTPAGDLCRDCPELTPELERRIDLLRRFEALMGPCGPASGTLVTSVLTPPRADTNPSATTDLSDGPVDDDRPPILPGYEILGPVGRGGMGVVFKARRLDLNRVEAVKMIRAGEFATPRQLARFRFEAEAAARIEHQNIVPVYGVGETAGRPYLAMRWVDGTSLADRPRRSPEEAARLVAQVARAVHFAHRRGILHRDLKPQNILVDAAGEPYVTDFGVARRLDSEHTLMTQAGGIVGTAQYMPPEQARADPNPTVASDVYALGGVLYYCLTGRPPFDGPNPMSVLARVIDAQPDAPRKLNPGVDADLEAICLKCLEKDPSDRYPSAEALADDLDRHLHGEEVSARPPGIWDWLRQLLKTRPQPSPNYSWPVLVWFGAILLAFHAVIYGLVRGDRSAASVWVAHVGYLAAMWAVIWVYMARRFRRLLVSERHSMMIAVGHLMAHLGLAVAVIPFSTSAPARDALALYPGLLAVSGLGLFVVGSTHWSRFILIGLGVMALTPVMTAWPVAAPLLYGVLIAAVMWYWAYAKKVTFGGPAGSGEPRP